MFRKLLVALCVAGCGIASAAPLQVSEFDQLSAQEQERILGAAYSSISVTLAFAQGGDGGSRVAVEFSRCLRDRDIAWVKASLDEYLAELTAMPTSLGGAVTQALAWKCGFLIIK